MQATTEPVLVLGYGEWDIDGEPVTRKDGTVVEYVKVLDVANDQSHTWSLSPEVNGERPKALTEARLIVDVVSQEREGRRRLKATVLGFHKS